MAARPGGIVAKILLRSARDPFEVIEADDPRAWGNGFYGTNVGNLLFADSTHRLLSVPGTEIVANRFVHERRAFTADEVAATDDEYDHFVVPLANALRPEFTRPLTRLTAFIEQISIPTTVVGIGAQLSLEELDTPPDDELAALHRRFMNSVLERSSKVGVRGEITAEYLRRLGYGDEHVEIIGCPSIYLNGPGLTVRDERSTPIADDDPVAVSMSPLTSPWFETYVDAFADRHPHMTYVGQTHHDFAMLQWGRHRQPETGLDRDHRLYFEDRTRMFLDSGSWMRFLATQRFAFGTRIHGNVAAVLAGTPAMVIAHDSRVLELCDYHGLPYTMLDSITPETTVDELYQAADHTAFHNRLDEGWKRLTAFLDDAGLANVAQPGRSSAAYDAELAALEPAAPVVTLRGTGDDALRRIEDRIHALKTASEHADTAAERRETELEKRLEKTLAASLTSHDERIAALEATTRKQQTRIKRQARRLDRQRALIKELRADLARHQERAGLRGFVRRLRRRPGS
ncbi:polysaccharide pyruvyl transferase family protein [Nocardioides sp. NPDC126508]